MTPQRKFFRVRIRVNLTTAVSKDPTHAFIPTSYSERVDQKRPVVLRRANRIKAEVIVLAAGAERIMKDGVCAALVA